MTHLDHGPTDPRVAAVIPAFNEEATVAGVIRAALAVVPEVVVASDGSTDRTAEVAREAGATVLDLQPNAGKGAALAAALRATDAEYVLMLDADLTGTTPAHLRRLLDPVLTGALDMTIGVFEGGKFMSEWGNRLTPQLSGQRACRRAWLLSVPRLSDERWPEPAITDHMARTGVRWDYVVLPEMGQVLKEKKRGLLRGVMYRTQMYADLLSYGARRRLAKHRSGEDESGPGSPAPDSTAPDSAAPDSAAPNSAEQPRPGKP